MHPAPDHPSHAPGSAIATAGLGPVLAAALARRAPRDLADPGRRAAVLLLLYDRLGEAHLLLTKRSDHLPSHPGQVSLPGGGCEPRDRDLMHTALRETEEEVGIDRAQVRVIGRLDDVNTMGTGFIIRPYVGVADTAPTPRPADAEVARIIEVPVAEVLQVDAGLPPNAGIALMRYPLDGEDVWGATARILRTFSDVARSALAGMPPES